MAARKDMMRIIRQDAGFSAKLGFGETSSMKTAPAAEVASSAPTLETTTLAGPVNTDASERAEGPPAFARADRSETPEREKGASPVSNPGADADGAVPSGRGQVVYVALSLTERQACLAERWAGAARCSVPFLIRRVAQGLRDQVCDDWEHEGMPNVDEERGARGKYPTSVTLTLRPGFAAALAARHDPLGLVGLGRAMGPAFRARFQKAFDQALENVKGQIGGRGGET